ncbi:hypothetical protein AAGR22_05435 [Erwinia sp. HDF1-3R]|uniref:hypothetical protein n=1 Tax=Erwinia sp. HDF1-3R TaxID=3141543 RepID=UPI0031F58379
MKKKLLMLSSLIAFTMIFIFIFKNHKEKGISCKAEITFLKGNDRVDVVSFHTLINGKGTISMSGVVHHGEKKAGYISKSIRFSYKKSKNIYLLRSDLISNSPYMTLSPEVENQWFPLFFSTKGEHLLWKIKPVGDKAWLFYSKTAPLFICEEAS